MNQDSTLPLQHDINQESNPLMTLLETNPIIQFHPSQPDDIINFSMLNHVNQQNSTLQSVSTNQNDTFSARSGSPTVVQVIFFNLVHTTVYIKHKNLLDVPTET